MISSPALNSSSFDRLSSRSRSFPSRSLNLSDVAKANMWVKLPHCGRKSTADPKAQVGESRLRRPRVAARAAKLRGMRVPRAAARALETFGEGVGAPLPDVAGAVVEAV